MVEDLGPGGGPAHRAGEEVIDMVIQPAIGLDSDSVEDAFILQVCVDIGEAKAASPRK
jgi:hypothetical protein